MSDPDFVWKRTPGQLTPREQEILRHVSQGRTQPEIAAALWLSVETVKTHVRRIREELGAHTSAQAVAIAYSRGLITLAPQQKEH